MNLSNNPIRHWLKSPAKHRTRNLTSFILSKLNCYITGFSHRLLSLLKVLWGVLPFIYHSLLLNRIITLTGTIVPVVRGIYNVELTLFDAYII